MKQLLLFALSFTTLFFLQNSKAQYQNTAYGGGALESNTTGTFNTAFGFNALYYNTIGSHNNATGNSSLLWNTTGNYNTAYGGATLVFNTSGSNNTATGSHVLYKNITGINNSALGSDALYSNTSGNYNLAIGYQALYSNTTANYNTALGYQSLYYNTTGQFNAASGFGALLKNTTGNHNTAGGANALAANTTGSGNTAIGDSAGALYGYTNSTFVGFKTTTSESGLKNVTVLGNGASATASNQVRIGNNAITSIGGKVGWTTLSDGRFKKNIQEDVPGLTFITKLRPVTYTLDIDGINKATGVMEETSIDMLSAKAAAAKEKHTGFIAQDVEKVAKELNYDFSGVDAAKNDNDLYGLRYADFVVPLVKAVQELDEIQNTKFKVQNDAIAVLQKENNDLKERLSKLEALMNVQQTSLFSNNQVINITNALLEQNIPNPFNHTTTINYTLPQQYSSANIMLTDKNGKALKTITLSGNKGSVMVDASTLSSGAYSYSLFIDGRLIDNKQMLLTK